MGFYVVLDRPFDPVLDWVLLDDAVDFLADSVGRAGAIGAAVAASSLLAVGRAGRCMTLSVLRLARVVARHRDRRDRAASRCSASPGSPARCSACRSCPGVPVAASSAAALVYDRVLQVRAGLRDRQAFAAEAAVDAFRDTPGDQLLTALRGKDVIIAFVESYGRDAVEDPEFAPQVGAVLDAGTRGWRAAGFASRSAFLTSPTAGGGSWLAHATLLSGLWIDNQQRYRNLVASDRLTLNGAFRRAGWRTVGVMPAHHPGLAGGRVLRLRPDLRRAQTSATAARSSASRRCPTSTPWPPSSAPERAGPNRAPVMAEIAARLQPRALDAAARGSSTGTTSATARSSTAMAAGRRRPDEVCRDPARSAPTTGSPSSTR